MDTQQGGGIAASVNMWALLADNDPGDNQDGAVDTGAGDAQPPMAAEVTDVADGKAQSSTVGDQKHKKKKKKTKKQAKAEEPAAMTNRGVAQSLFVAAATTALVAFSFHVSASAV
jgi:hypothetical protein